MLKLQLRDKPDSAIKLSVATVTLGRDDSNDMVIDSSSVSDFHAEISSDSGQPEIVDLLSANGTFVNERRISARHALIAWDVIRLGGVELEVTDPNAHRPEDWALRAESDLPGDRYHPLGASTVVGRNPDCELAIEDNLLSRRHARLIIEDQHLKVIDLGSANGTFLNGERIQEGIARPGDELRFDCHSFTVVGPAAAQREDPLLAPEETILRGAVDDATVVAAAPVIDDTIAPAAQSQDHTQPFTEDETLLFAPPPLPASLLAASGTQDAPAAIPLDSDAVSVGRHPDCEITLENSSVSKRHAEFTFQASEWRLRDLGSSNGTLVNDRDISETGLADGDRIQFGRLQFEFSCPGARHAEEDPVTMVFQAPDKPPPAAPRAPDHPLVKPVLLGLALALLVTAAALTFTL